MTKTDLDGIYAIFYFSPRTGEPSTPQATLYTDRERAEEKAAQYAKDKQLTMFVVKLETVTKISPNVTVERVV
jgi:hypothetical protein